MATIMDRSNGTIVPIDDLTEEEIAFAFDTENVVKVNYRNKYFLTTKAFYNMEKFIAKNLLARVNKLTSVDEQMIDIVVSDYEAENGITLSDEQRRAVKGMVKQKVAILTGGPGTGKTSVLKCLLRLIVEKEKKNGLSEAEAKKLILCLAPTGKASRRMTEATQYPAHTVQRAYKLNPAKETLMHLNAKYIIIDEFSMVDTKVFADLFKALKYNTDSYVYIVGDSEQLPSVGKGSVLRDLTKSSLFPYYELKTVFRQKEGSTLLTNIDIIKKGGLCPFIPGDDFHKHETLDDFFDVYNEALDTYGLDNICILTPTRKVGEYSSERLNSLIQNKVNPGKGLKTFVYRDGRKLNIEFRVGDPVIQLKNREIANGDIGKVIGIKGNTLVVKYEETIIRYSCKEFSQLDLAYAITIHKSQGSEYKCCLIVFPENVSNIDKNMVYTGVTRAKQVCHVFGKEAKIQEFCKKSASDKRPTNLQYILQEEALLATF